MELDMRKCAKRANPRFIPYLEKHRIYELFFDIGQFLVMEMPPDHVLFMRKLMMDLGEIRGKARIILVTPPQISGKELAEIVQTSHPTMRIIGFQDLLMAGEDNISSEELATRFNGIVADESLETKGWIIYDFPRHAEEARYLQKHRILPTHTFEICASPEKYSRTDAWCINVKKWQEEDLQKALADHQRKVFGLNISLNSTYKKIPVEGRSLEELGADLLRLMRIPVAKGAPIVPRVLLIGTRGSRRRSVAMRLHEYMNLPHRLFSLLDKWQPQKKIPPSTNTLYILDASLWVDYFRIYSNTPVFSTDIVGKTVDVEELMLGALNLEDDIGDELRRLKERKNPIFFRIIMSLIKRRMEQSDCLTNGWVMTSFPRNLGDLVELDKLDTPPNKVIFFSIDNKKAMKRLLNRKVNVYNGAIKTTKEIKCNPFEDMCEYMTHPRDMKENVVEEQEEFAKNVQDMLDYCGDNCEIMDAKESAEVLAARVLKAISLPGPIVGVRKLKEGKSQDPGLQQTEDMRFTLIGKDDSKDPQATNLVGGIYLDYYKD